MSKVSWGEGHWKSKVCLEAASQVSLSSAGLDRLQSGTVGGTIWIWFYAGKTMWCSESGDPFIERMSWLSRNIISHDFLTFTLTFQLPVLCSLGETVSAKHLVVYFGIFLLIISSSSPLGTYKLLSGYNRKPLEQKSENVHSRHDLGCSFGGIIS